MRWIAGLDLDRRMLDAKALLQRRGDIGEAGIVEFMPRMEGTTLHAILAPSKKAEPAAPKPKPAAQQPAAAPGVTA